MFRASPRSDGGDAAMGTAVVGEGLEPGFLTVPAVLGRRGVHGVARWQLDDAERAAPAAGARGVRRAADDALE